MNVDKREFGSIDGQNEKNVIEAFNYFDINNNGQINLNDIKRVLTTFGDKMSEQEFNDIFKAFNKDLVTKDNINYMNFIELAKDYE